MTRRWTADSRRVAALAGVLGVLAFGAVAAAQQPLDFDVSSIKPNMSGAPGGDTRRLPDGTYTATNISIHNLLPLAWPTEDREYRNLPDWARRNRYDVTVKPPSGASAAEIQEMWRALFKSRFKLEAHNETREGPIFALVLARADGQLGPQLTPRPHDCPALAAAAAAAPIVSSPTPPSADHVMATCGSVFRGTGCSSAARCSPRSRAHSAGRPPPIECEQKPTSFEPDGRPVWGAGPRCRVGLRSEGGVQLLSGGSAHISELVRWLQMRVDRPIVDRTGLPGLYAIRLEVPRLLPAEPGALPSGPSDMGTAVREQLGLSLAPRSDPTTVLMIDHVEVPMPN